MHAHTSHYKAMLYITFNFEASSVCENLVVINLSLLAANVYFVCVA